MCIEKNGHLLKILIFLSKFFNQAFKQMLKIYRKTIDLVLKSVNLVFENCLKCDKNVGHVLQNV